MPSRSYSACLTLALVSLGSSLSAQVAVTGRAVDETGAGLAGVRVELLPSGGGVPSVTSSDLAGSFSLNVKAEGEYDIRAERKGFFLFRGRGQRLSAPSSQLTIVLNHVQEFSERIDVTYSPPAVDLEQTSDRKELDNTEMQAIPYPAPQDYRASLPLMDGVVQDNAGRVHFNGAETSQTNYTLDGFNISDPVTGRLEARVNIESIQSMDLQSGRFSAENGRGSGGVLDLKTKMGDDRWRFGGTNFIPGVSSTSGLHVNKWTPRVEFSGPLARRRAWFHNGLDGFYFVDTVSGLPKGQNRTQGLTASDLSRVQVNLTPSNILTASFLFNLNYSIRAGLSVLNPAEATSNHRQTLYMSGVRDQQYFGGAMLDLGFSDTRAMFRDVPQGNLLYQVTPLGNRGNYFASLARHAYRQQWIANLFLPTQHLHGTHQLKFGIDFEREAFHQVTVRHDYEVLRADGSLARYVTFAGNPYQSRKNFEGAQYIEDHWKVFEGLSVEAGLRAEWNEIVRDLEVAPRFAVVWAPRRLPDTKFTAGWGVYHDAISLGSITRQQDQVSESTFYLADGTVHGPIRTAFAVDDQALVVPHYQTASLAVERRMPRQFYLKTGYMHRAGNYGFTFVPNEAEIAAGSAGDITYRLVNSRRDRYDAFDISLRRTFARQFEWFAGYTRSRARTSAAVDYSLENPIFGPQMPGPFSWDTPHRFHMWGFAPLPTRLLPGAIRFVTRNTAAGYLVEYRTGFPFGVVNEEGFMVGRPNSMRYPNYLSINLSFERKFRAIHYLWAWRVAFDNLTNNGNPNAVNNVMGTSQYLTFARGQARAFSMRLRFLGRK